MPPSITASVTVGIISFPAYYQVVRMKELVHEIDPLAYITISKVADDFSSNNNSTN